MTSFLSINRKKVITDLDIFNNCYKTNRVISITGTNGKSTTCKILEEIFKKARYDVRLVGNIGKPILSLKKINSKTIIIVEVSSYQLEYTQYFRSNHAAILNISPDHIERHLTINNYISAKKKSLSSKH